MLISRDSKIFIAGHSGMVGSAIKRTLIQKDTENFFVQEAERSEFIKF